MGVYLSQFTCNNQRAHVHCVYRLGGNARTTKVTPIISSISLKYNNDSTTK